MIKGPDWIISVNFDSLNGMTIYVMRGERQWQWYLKLTLPIMHWQD